MNKIKKYRFDIIKYLFIAGLIVLAIVNFDRLKNIFSYLLTISMPIILGFIIAYILNIPMVMLEKLYFPNSDSIVVKKTRRPVSILVSIIIITVVLIFILNLVIPQLISVFGRIIEIIPVLANGIQSWVIENEEIFPPLAEFVETFQIDWQNIVTNMISIVNRFTTNIIETTLSTVGSVFSIVVNLFLSLMISLYVLMSKETLGRQFRILSETYLPERGHKGLMYVLEVTDYSFRHFITGEVLEALILGSLVTVGMWIFQFPYASMIGALTGVTALIPVLGAYISGAIGFIMILVDSPIQALTFLVFIIVIQQLEGNLIYPRVVGGSIGLPGLWVLISITIGGGLLGIWGMLLAVPLVSTLFKLLKNDIEYRRNNRYQEQEYVDVVEEINESDELKVND
ncbi:MAG TPA: AI-2E family transporter [Facklamia tabacinasalis]|uniref:AI-2E family transporter n=1 Tax=Ruoffia tabacinasalis TaxID=87458 RepID=A0A5R9DWA6_9LACT|nr:AI-2E family transporter [Ruoffia tabacinasalis]TLQ40498.1 AI-2E family transporter [Ruoffia tabacinasalis]HJG47858.1 AI-2E family transporter [Ruoffia tabacinasalis]